MKDGQRRLKVTVVRKSLAFLLLKIVVNYVDCPINEANNNFSFISHEGLAVEEAELAGCINHTY